MSGEHPHGGQRVATFGSRPEAAPVAVVLLHGRGASAGSILDLARHLGHPDLAWLAPQAAGNSWYPKSFLAPLDDNQPHLGSALLVLERLTGELAQRGVPAQRTVLAGFSQGACLASELVARHPRRWGGLAAFTGGVLGPLGEPRTFPGDLAGTPVFFGAGDPDPHVPWRRVEETAEHFRGMGAEVTLRRYPGLPHTVNRDELDWLQELLGRLTGAP